MKQFLKKIVLEVATPIAGVIAGFLNLRLTSPIVIVGTGRSGTTLLGRILNSHPDVTGYLEEGNELWHPCLEPFEEAKIDFPPIEINPQEFTEISLQNWPVGQAERIYQTFDGYHLLAGKSKSFYVKSAMISFMIPKILEIYPDARFVHIYRNGPSVVESYFKKNFGKYSRFEYGEQEYYRYCAQYWNACINEIDRVNETLMLEQRGILFEFSYESLCDNPEQVVRELAEFIDVDFDRFRFDFSTIQSQNYKVQLEDSKWGSLMEIMGETMERKGYEI